MANAVFFQVEDSPYDDQPGVAYHFPRAYLRRVEETQGDWVVIYEGVKRGRGGYVAVAKVAEIAPDPKRPGHY